MLAKDPEQRWSSCGELLRELYRIQVEYCPLATPEELASWDSVGMEPLSDPRLRAQRQLAEAMRGLPQSSGGRGRWVLAAAMAAGMVVAMVAGGSAAWFTMRPTPLTLSQHSEKPGIPVEDSELRQWFQATRIGTAEAWQSVIDYPDVTEVVKLRAEQQLAWVYLNELEFDRALQVFDELASSSESNAEFKAFGLAGKCGVLSLQEKYAESADVLNQFLPYRTFLARRSDDQDASQDDR